MPLYALIGPTAVGKTDVAIELARWLDAEIVGCDSMQVYREMAALTDQPTTEHRAAVPHHLVDCVEPTETFSVGRYRALAMQAIGAIRGRGRAVLLVGGTGLYLRAIRRGLCEAPAGSPAVRDRLSQAATTDGEALFARLLTVDPEAAARIDPRNTRRVVRALEVFELTGRPLSTFWREQSAAEVPMTVIGLMREREDLYRRINRRVERMFDDERVRGEVRTLADRPLSKTALQVHGLRFLLSWMRGAARREDAIAAWQAQVRQYAKRQGTWFRAEPGVHWIMMEEPDVMPRIVDVVARTVTA